ncbi:hypothetical protein NP233_g1726 [Leucocoprinus birnbaumii]|uniref:Uncharacterized protein n=1 Tax=Leucocoprinus birnbaumii TaxID=56174 RepID=A0AAD5W221_9AGAR|nr:hypothetical protein NP233_g1726 [Leucocoprinus birnbaumii]
MGLFKQNCFKSLDEAELDMTRRLFLSSALSREKGPVSGIGYLQQHISLRQKLQEHFVSQIQPDCFYSFNMASSEPTRNSKQKLYEVVVMQWSGIHQWSAVADVKTSVDQGCTCFSANEDLEHQHQERKCLGNPHSPEPQEATLRCTWLNKDPYLELSPAFIAVDRTPNAVRSDTKPFLNSIKAHVGSGLQGRGRRNVPSEEPLFEFIGMLASAVGPNLTKLLQDRFDLTMSCGLSEPPKNALVIIAKHILFGLTSNVVKGVFSLLERQPDSGNIWKCPDAER